MIFIKELPHIFKKNIDSKHINNKRVSYASNKINNDIDNNIYIFDKLDKLFKSSRYVFNIRVIIKTKSKVYDTKIISRNNNNLLTVDDDVIPIKEISELIIKDRY